MLGISWYGSEGQVCSWLRYNSRCVPFCCPRAQDAVHLGRYGPEGELCSEIVAALVADTAVARLWLGFAVFGASHAVFLCRQACDARHHAGDAVWCSSWTRWSMSLLCGPRLFLDKDVHVPVAASWPVRTRCTVLRFSLLAVACARMCKARFAGILHLALCFLLPLLGPDALHHGRYGPDRQLRGEILADMPVVHDHRCSVVQTAENC